MTIQAVYAGGVFKPLLPLTLAEGSHVEIFGSVMTQC